MTGMPPACQGKRPGHAVLPGLGQSQGAWLRPGALGPGWIGGPLNPPAVNHSILTWHWPPSRPPPCPLAPRLAQAGHPGGESTSKVGDSESLERQHTCALGPELEATHAAPPPHTPKRGGGAVAVPGPSQGYQRYLVPSHKPLLTRDLLSHAVLTLAAKPTDQMGQGASPPAPTIWPSAPRKCPLSVLPVPSSSPLRPLPLRRLLAQTPFPCPRSPPSLT